MPVPKLPAGMHVFERGWLSSNNILFAGGEQTLLVDSGYCAHAAQTLLLVEGVLKGRDLDSLVNTHLHSDHCGGNAALQSRYPELRTLIPPGQAAQVADWDPEQLSYLPTGQHCPKFGFTQALRAGSNMLFGDRLWEIHAAPGHDPHSLLFFEPVEKILISADALWENGFGVVFPELEGEHAFSEVSATLDVIEQLAPQLVIPGHGDIFMYSPEILARSRSRLNAFVQSPAKHANHAAKVLMKFKLLEVQRQTVEDFERWASSTSYFKLIHNRFFSSLALTVWIGELSAALIGAGVATRDGEFICNA